MANGQHMQHSSDRCKQAADACSPGDCVSGHSGTLERR